MHELSLTRSIVSLVQERAGSRKVRRVKLRVGQLAGVEISAIRFCFDLCTKQTVLEGARLEIEEVAGRARCPACGRELSIAHLATRCPCGQRAPLQILAGEELLVKEMEV